MVRNNHTPDCAGASIRSSQEEAAIISSTAGHRYSYAQARPSTLHTAHRNHFNSYHGVAEQLDCSVQAISDSLTSRQEITRDSSQVQETNKGQSRRGTEHSSEDSSMRGECTEQRSLFEGFNVASFTRGISGRTAGLENSLRPPAAYTQPFCDFLTENPTIWHAVSYFEARLKEAGFQKLSERQSWQDKLTAGGKYFVARNGSSLVAFAVGGGYKSGNGIAMVAGHIDALTARLKPMSNKKTRAGYLQLGVAPYAGGLNTTWWDRDLGLGGRVLVKDSTGKIVTKLVKLGWPIARIPTLAPHFGVGMMGQNNQETQAVPIIGLDDSEAGAIDEYQNLRLGDEAPLG